MHGRALVAYLTRAERFLSNGGCPYCASLIMQLGAPTTCACGWVKDPLLTFTLRHVATPVAAL